MRHLAIDIGAESGRAVIGEINEGVLECREIARFANGPIRVADSLRWDIDALVASVRECVRKGEAEGAVSVGVDAWGVDYVLLDSEGKPLETPFHYRDSRTEGVKERAFAIVPKERIYQRTGIQFLRFNTLFQLMAEEPAVLSRASRLLAIPDYLNFLLLRAKVEEARSEYTIASTTQMLAPTGDWDRDLLRELDLGRAADILAPVVLPGTILGETPSGIKVVAPACHDTASAVAAMPGDKDSAWISSGTWSIMGVEVREANLSATALAAGFTNEGGVCGTVRLCKNVMGLWILQECRRAWQAQGLDLSYEQLNGLAADCAGREFDVNDDSLLAAGPDMPDRVNALLEKAGSPPAHTPGEFTRAILESLASAYSSVLRELEKLQKRKFAAIHVFGGGCQNAFLNELTARACGVPVVAGPVEATAIGNLLMQMLACGEIESLQDGREIVRRSFEAKRFAAPAT